MDFDFTKGMSQFSAVVKKQGEKPPTSDVAIERLLAVKDDVNDAENDGLMVPVPRTEQDGSKDISRIKTIRNRLYILGYLEKDSGKPKLDAPLKDAIRQFQKDAGLKIDGWVGEEETWPALQELVSFEAPIQLENWFTSSKPKPVLRRAIALRLFVLGLKEKKPVSADDDIETGLRSFGRVWRILNLGETQSEPGVNLEWLGLLFDMDGITRRLSTVKVKLSDKDIARVHGFVLNAAKIELWLMGYPVRPGGYDLEKRKKGKQDFEGLTDFDVWMKSKTITRFRKIKKNMKFYKSLHQFWLDHGKDDDSADKLSVDFLEKFKNFFEIANQGLQTDREMSVVERQEEIEALLTKPKKQIPSVWKTVRSIGSRIWDGIQRVWGWFKRVISAAKKKIVKIGRNLSRIVYDFALGSFTVVSNIFKSIGTTFEVISREKLPGSDSGQVVFYRDLDFDPRVVVNESADRHEVARCCEILKRETRMFAFGCRVLGAFISILVDLFQSARAAYLGLVLALIKLRKTIHKLKALTAEYRSLFGAPA